jgi:lysylphosphatidylglycerol synthetase-like protein (DUF2156 family)
MYGEDGLFTLTTHRQAGLALLSVILSVFMIVVTRAFTRGWPWIVRLMLTLVLMWVFMWLSPQVYYSYQSLLSEDLPARWVIGMPPPLGKTLRVVTFTGPADLTHHGQGALGLLMLFAGLSRDRQREED